MNRSRRGLAAPRDGWQPVVQEDRTGCGLATVAALCRQPYRRIKLAASAIGIECTDTKLWSETAPVRRLLQRLGVRIDPTETAFSGWQALPDLALLAIKWRREARGPAWHWTLFVRDGSGNEYVLDPKKALKTNRRTDFGRMKPKWFIGVRAV